MESAKVRRLDELGRLVIPSEIRDAINLEIGDELIIALSDEAIILKKVKVYEGNE